MKKILGFCIVLFMFVSCRLNGNNDKYILEGTIKNPAHKAIMLEKLGLQAITLVDSAKIDDKGFFTMQGVSEKGFYRLKLDDKTFFLFLLEPAKYKVDIDAANQETPFKITGSAENDEFQQAIKNVSSANYQFEMAKYMYMAFQQMHVGNDSMMQAANNVQMAGMYKERLCKDSVNSVKSALVAMYYVTNLPVQTYDAEYQYVLSRLQKESPNSSYTKDFKETHDKVLQQAKAQEQQQQQQQEAATNIAVGKPAPEIEEKNPDGKVIKLSSLKGKVVLIDFWASWCGPCRAEMPNVIAAYNKFKSKGFTVYSVSLDKDMNAWKNSIANLGMPWENHVSDLQFWKNEAAARYGVNSIPAAFLLDKNGIIVATTDLRGPMLEKKLAEILK